MQAESRFHVRDKNYLANCQGSISNAKKAGHFTADDELILTAFLNEISGKNHITPNRRFKLVTTLVGWRRYIGEYRKNDVTEIYRGIQAVHEATKPDGRPWFKKNTIRDYVRFLRRFYIWMIKNGYSTIPMDKISEITPPPEDKMTKVAGDLLSEDEVMKMVNTCKNSRDRALIMTLYEGAFRIGELGNMTWNQLKMPEKEDWSIKANVNEKTGRPRYIPLMLSKPYLFQWRQDYPKSAAEPEGDAFVFVTITGKPRQLQYQSIRKVVRNIAEEAGITKPVTLHIFRHSRITELIRQGVGSEHIKKIGWGNVTTKMFSTYLHLTNDDIDREMMKVYGIEDKKEVKKKNLRPIQCPTCQEINRPDAKFCFKCGRPFSEEALIEQSSAIAEINKLTPALTPAQIAEIVEMVTQKMKAAV